jgi:hypothetical protein
MSLLAGRAQAQSAVNQDKVYPGLGIAIRNGDYFVFQPGLLFMLGAPGESRRPIAAIVRGELGVGGSGGGLGLAIDWFPSTANPYPNPEEFLYGGLMMLEARVERMYGQTSWRHTTYVGPQVSLNLMLKLSVGWMVDVHDDRNQHIQVGVGAGF